MRRLLFLVAIVASVACSREPAANPEAGQEGDAHTQHVHSPAEFAKEADVPVYPGATFPEKESNLRGDATETRYEIVMFTKDSPEKVEAFYLKALEKTDKTGQTLMGMTPKHHYAMVSSEKTPTGTKVKVIVVASKSTPSDGKKE